jgi:DNA-directed RNA polymerase specialized sigma subunit
MDKTVNVRATLKLTNLDMIEARRRSGLTLTALAKAAKTTANIICQLQRFEYAGGKSRPQTLRQHADRIAAVLGIDPEVVMPTGLEEIPIQSKVVVDKSIGIDEMRNRLGMTRMITENPVDSIVKTETVGLMREAIGRLSARRRNAIEHELAGDTMEHSATKMGISRSRVDQLRKKAYEDLRRLMTPTLRTNPDETLDASLLPE